MKTQSKPAADTSPPYFVGDDLALDFLNSSFGSGANRHDCLDSDQAVLDWLARAGLAMDTETRTQAREGLLEAAISLRETGRALLKARKAGSTGKPDALNRSLASGRSYRQLVWKAGQAPAITLHRDTKGAHALLVPVAEALADLLVNGDIALIRKCQNPDCTLWFCDRTKAHRRRWCSMSLCGNRTKVAAFRARQKSE